MRQPTQKYSLKDDQKIRATSVSKHQFLHPQDQTQNQLPQSIVNQKSHDHQTQAIYDLMNLQNKHIGIQGAGQRQTGLKMPIVQNKHSYTVKGQSSTHQGSLFSLHANHVLDDHTLPANPLGSNTQTTGQFLRQAGLVAMQQREQMNMSPDHQIQSQFNTNGFDPSDRSTTANTGFPQLSTKGSSFHRKQNSSSQQQNEGNFNNAAQNILNKPSLGQNPISNGSNIGKQIRGRTNVARKIKPTIGEQQDKNLSLNRNSLKAEGVGAQPINIKGQQLGPMDKFKEKTNIYNHQLNSLNQGQSHLLSNVTLTLQHSDDAYPASRSPPKINKYRQRQTIGSNAQQNEAQQSTNKILQFYHMQTQGNNITESQENAMTLKDIKIRKLNPQQKPQKQSLRFQTAQQILDNQQQFQNSSMIKKPEEIEKSEISHDEALESVDSSANLKQKLMNRKKSDSDKDQQFFKSLTLEERKKLIQQHKSVKVSQSRNDDIVQSLSDELDNIFSPVKATAKVQEKLEKTKQNDEEVKSMDLGIIEEEAHNEDARSQFSKRFPTVQNTTNTKNNGLQSTTTLSSGTKQSEKAKSIGQQPNLLQVKQVNSDQSSPIITKFKEAMLKSETFKMIYMKLKEGIVSKETEEYDRLISNLSRISGLTIEETENCIEQSKKKGFRERFQNPYLKKSSSSYGSIIEENIQSYSLNHSFSMANVNQLGFQNDYPNIHNLAGGGIWNQPLGVFNAVKNLKASSIKLRKGASIDDTNSSFVNQQTAGQESKSGGQPSDKRSQFSKKSSDNISMTQETNRRRLGNYQSQRSNKSNDYSTYKINVNPEQEQLRSQRNDDLQQSKSLELNSRSLVRQSIQTGLAIVPEHLKQRGQSIQPPQFNDVLSGQKLIAGKVNNQIYGNLIKWKEIKKIGQGTSGEVFLAQNQKTFQNFVVKKLQLFSANSGVDKDALAKLKKEIEVNRKLDHTNVVKYIGSEIVNNQFCIYLEYMSGGSLCSVYQKQGRFSEPIIKSYTKQILKGLVYLHQNKVIHCDLKGANVLVDQSGIVKLSDFGCAKLFESSLSMSDFNGAIRGSLPWMAPEVLMNKGIRRKADIWSLGCLVIEMAVAGNPWGNLLGTEYNIQAIFKLADPNLVPVIPDELSDQCRDFIMKCLIRDYEKRPTAAELQSHPWLNE